MMMFITKKRHEAETEHLRDEISRLRGARMMDAETIRQQDERHRKAVKDLAAQSDEIEQRRKEKRSEEHTSELQSLMRISYAVFCLKKKKIQTTNNTRKEKEKDKQLIH